MRYDPVIVAEGSPFNLQQGYPAYSLIIDNLTASWIYSLDASRFILPFTYGAVIPLAGTQTPRLSWETPASITPNPAGNGQATVIITDAQLPPANGSSIFTQGALPSDLGRFFRLGAAGTSVQQIPLPSGTVVIGVFPEGASIYLNVIITGTQTGIQYFLEGPAVFTAGTAASFATIDPLDMALTLTMQTSASQSRGIRIVAYPFTPLGLEQGAVQNVNVLTTPGPVSHIAQRVVLAANATSAVVPVQATLTLYAYTLSVDPVGTAAGGYELNLEDDLGTIVDLVRCTVETGAGLSPNPSKSLAIPNGLSLGVNHGLRLHANSGNAGSVLAQVAAYYT